MGEATGISWADDTFNPWWGCTKVSSACDSCYAETLSKRVGNAVWGKSAPRRIIGDKTWNDPRRWDKAAERAGVRRRVFCASMADVFEDHNGPMVDHKGNLMPGRSVAAERERLWALIDDTPNLDWLLLTKRPQNIARLAPPSWLTHGAPFNVWLGTTVETQPYAKIRIPQLLEVRATVHFLSYEPGLGEVDLRPWLGEWGVNWVIVGGESGHNARPFPMEWARSVIVQARAAPGAAVWMKQMGQAWAEANGYGPTHGDDPATWPEDLRVQQLPQPLYAAAATGRLL